MTPPDATEPLPSAPVLPPAPGSGSGAVTAGRPVAPRRRPPHRRGRGVALAAAGAVALAALVGGSAYALQSSPSASYRTALVTRSSVVETLQRSGTIEPVAQASVAFPMSGTVATVSVAPGQTVTTGQPLASLNTTSLEADLTSKQATLAQAQLVVSQAVTSDATVTSDTSATSGTSSAGTKSSTKSNVQTEATTSGASSGSKTQTDPNTLQKAMAVTGDQQQVDQSLQSATAAVQTATDTCTVATTAAGAGAGGASSVGASGVAASGVAASIQAKAAAAVASATGSASSPSAPSTTIPASAAGASATTCADAEQAALTDQQNLASAETSLAQAEAVLQGALTTSSATVTPAATSATPSTTSPSNSSTPKAATQASPSPAGTGTGSGSGFGSSGAGGSTSGVTSAAQLVADQAAVDADQAQVTAAQQSLAQATIVSPINGTVASVGVSVGQSVSADSSTDNVIVVGQGGWEVATTVPVANIANVKVGDAATVLPDGFSTTLAGQVVQIGVAATTSGTTTTYPVTIGFNNSPSGLGNGASATVTIDMAQAGQALTVPTSAVHSAGGFHYVTTISKGTVTNTPIQIGAMGDDRTVVTGGLTLGQEVVLAVVNAPLPASNTAGATGLGSVTAVPAGGRGNLTFRVGGAGAGG
jgi:trimeric autotransporter adhesin